MFFAERLSKPISYHGLQHANTFTCIDDDGRIILQQNGKPCRLAPAHFGQMLWRRTSFHKNVAVESVVGPQQHHTPVWSIPAIWFCIFFCWITMPVSRRRNRRRRCPGRGRNTLADPTTRVRWGLWKNGNLPLKDGRKSTWTARLWNTPDKQALV